MAVWLFLPASRRVPRGTWLVTLVVAAGPGFPQGSPEHRYEIGVTLTPGGHLDAAAWLADPNPWTARRIQPGSPPRPGDVVYDADTESWAIRQESPFTKPIVRRAAGETRRNMTKTPERIEEVLTKQASTA